LSEAAESRAPKPKRIARIQLFAVSTLALAGIINYIDRGSLAIANTTIRADLGISATRMGVLLSIFSMSYAISQLPMGLLLDRLGERVVLGAGMFLWSATQAATGLIGSFRSFAMARIGLGLGESPYVVGSVKAVNDWFDVRDRATPTGIFNSSTAFGQAMAPPILTVAMLAFGWRGMFMLIGIPGMVLALVWYAFYRDRKDVTLDEAERAYLEASGPRSTVERVSMAQWLGLFKLRTMWGMMLGFGGVNYTAWLYMSWMPNYLEAEHHVSVRTTGLIAVIPFFLGGVGMFLSGLLADFLVRRGMAPIRTHRTILVTGMTLSGLSTLLVPYIHGATGAALGIGMALFFIYLAGNSGWGLVQSMSPQGMVASVGTIQNFGSFVFASMAPILTGWLLDRTHSFKLTLTICCMVTIGCAMSYVFVVKEPIGATPA
jgi:sugar phosphate permease